MPKQSKKSSTLCAALIMNGFNNLSQKYHLTKNFYVLSSPKNSRNSTVYVHISKAKKEYYYKNMHSFNESLTTKIKKQSLQTIIEYYEKKN